MLPKFQTTDQSLSLLQTAWATQIDPVIGSPIATPTILKGVALITGSNTVNHMLGQPLTGWFVVRQRSSASIYDTQDTNPIPDKTLRLVSSSGVNVDLMVF